MASAGSSLARDLSIRSENVTSNRVLSGRPRSRDATKSARLATGKAVNIHYFTSMAPTHFRQFFLKMMANIINTFVLCNIRSNYRILLKMGRNHGH